MKSLDDVIAGCWVNLFDPSPSEINDLVQKFGIPHDFLTAPLDADEIPRTEKEDSFSFVLIRIPFFKGKDDPVPYSTIPLGIVFNDDLLVTVCSVETELLREMTMSTARNVSTAKRHRFILRLFLRVANRYLQYLRVINKAVEQLEDRLVNSQRNEEVLQLLKYEKSLTYFMTALKGNEILMSRLQRSRIFEEYPEDEELLDDVVIEMRQAIEMTEIASGILSQMMDAFASIISNNLNVVMKFLAGITIILTFPTMLASFYGMNVRLPFADSMFAFPLTVGLSLAMVVTALLIFRRKNWL
jgi:magnesium transporter